MLATSDALDIAQQPDVKATEQKVQSRQLSGSAKLFPGLPRRQRWYEDHDALRYFVAIHVISVEKQPNFLWKLRPGSSPSSPAQLVRL